MSRVYRIYLTIRTSREDLADGMLDLLGDLMDLSVKKNIIDAWTVDADMEVQDDEA